MGKQTLSRTLDIVFDRIISDQSQGKDGDIESLQDALFCIYHQNVFQNKGLNMSNGVLFNLDDESVRRATNKVLCYLKDSLPDFSTISQPISYFIDELICNIQQHAKSECALIYANYNHDAKDIDICIADNGITILGSYVDSNKFTEYLSGGDIDAVALAKDGYSTKDLPDTENRGYGFSSNIKWIVNGFGGSIAILSGNAMYYAAKGTSSLISLPSEMEWPGTVVLAQIPIEKPENFNLYNYIS